MVLRQLTNISYYRFLRINNELEKVQRKLEHSEQESFKILKENTAMRLNIKLIEAEFEATRLEVGIMKQAKMRERQLLKF